MTNPGLAKPADRRRYGVLQNALTNCSGRGYGAACVTRTRDPVITNDVLYRLS